MWRFVLSIEDNKNLLKEYGRVIILLTNVEYYLKDLIKMRSGKIVEQELGKLIEEAKPYLAPSLYKRLKKLNEKRIRIVHGTVVHFGDINPKRGTEKIIKIDKNTRKEEVFPLNISMLKKISESARKLVRTLVDIRFR